jgi:hypothetical protein
MTSVVDTVLSNPSLTNDKVTCEPQVMKPYLFYFLIVAIKLLPEFVYLVLSRIIYLVL